MSHRAKVAVVQSSSHRLRFAKASRSRFRTNFDVPWIDLAFYGDEQLETLLDELERGEIHGLVFATECFQSPPVRRVFTSERAAAACRRAYERGMGICVFQQLSNEPIHCSFLPAPFGMTLEPVGRTSIAASALGSDPNFRASFRNGDDRGRSSLDLWRSETRSYETELRLATPSAWKPALWRKGNELPLLLRSRGSGPQIIVSALPLDWDAGAASVVRSLLARIVRSRGCIYVRRPGDPDGTEQRQFSDLVEDGSFIYEHESLNRVDLDEYPIFYFRDVLLSPGWDQDSLRDLDTEKIFGRIEKQGSFTAFLPGPRGEPLLVEIGTPPRYVERVKSYAEWLGPHLGTLHSLTPNIRAVAVVLATIRRVFRDKDSIPYEFAGGSVTRAVRDAIELRLGTSNNVDGKFLPTATIASALDILGEPERAQPLVEWLDERLAMPGESRSRHGRSNAIGPDEALPALIWLPGLRKPERVKLVLAEARVADGISRLHTWVAQLILDPVARDATATREQILEYASSPATNPQRRAEALLTMANASVWREHMPVGRLLEAELLLKRENRSLVAVGGTIESVSFQMAALLELEVREGLAATRERRRSASVAPVVTDTESFAEQLLDANGKWRDSQRKLHVAQIGSALLLVAIAAVLMLTTALMVVTARLSSSDTLTVVGIGIPVGAAVIAGVARELHKRGALPSAWSRR